MTIGRYQHEMTTVAWDDLSQFCPEGKSRFSQFSIFSLFPFSSHLEIFSFSLFAEIFADLVAALIQNNLFVKSS